MDDLGRRRPALTVRRGDGEPAGAVLVLHGGKVRSTAPVTRRQLAVVRVALLAAAVHDAVRQRGVDVWSLRFGVRGWNGDGASAVGDARWALDEIRAGSGIAGPIALVGHSMGARTALRVADAPGVRGVVGLAPWLADDDPVGQLAGRRIVLAHGTLDTVTSPRATRRYAELARVAGADVSFLDVRRDTHAMLRRPREWNEIAARGALDVLGSQGSQVNR